MLFCSGWRWTCLKISFTVPGQPVGKGRPRFARSGQYVRTYTPEKTAVYENLVKLEYERQCGGMKFEQGVPLDMRLTAYFQIPKSAGKKRRQAMEDRAVRPTGKPDADNILKAVTDGLNRVAFHDDSQIVDVTVRKYYSGEPRVTVTIQEA